jgi:AcrR family transcriptional regulator
MRAGYAKPPPVQAKVLDCNLYKMPRSNLKLKTGVTLTRTEEIYRTAAELMVEKGYGGTSISDIAQAVGMTKAGLYHHFSGKQQLLFQILNSAIDQGDRVVSEPVRSIEDPEQRLQQLIRLQIQGEISHGLAFIVLFSELNHLEPKQQRKIRTRVRKFHGLIKQALRELAEQDRLRDMDIDIATMHIMNAMTGVARWKHQNFASDPEHLIQETIAYTMAALLKRAG